jgi:RHS repeat-associated protein
VVQVTTAERAAEQSFPVFLASLPGEPLPGTHVYLLENSRLGQGAFVNAPHPAFPPVNFQNALEFPADVRPTRVRSRCTGQERDAETGLDYFGARYMSSAQGRFTSPDGPFNDQDPSDPQSWNLYAYTRNNPLIFVDPNGRECVTLDSGAKGDDGQGKFCNDKSLLTTHGVTVNGTTGDATYSAFCNAVLMGNIDLSGRKDQIKSAPDELLNALPVAKAALVIGKVGLTLGPLAVVIGKDALQHVLARHAANTVAQNVSKFAAGLSKDAVEGLINAALKDGAVTQGSKVAFYDLDLGVNIGTNQAGQATNTIRVLVDNATGKAITAYPK